MPLGKRYGQCIDQLYEKFTRSFPVINRQGIISSLSKIWPADRLQCACIVFWGSNKCIADRVN
jgi:hypothetical protein